MKMRTKNLVALLIALLVVLSTAPTYATEPEDSVFMEEFTEITEIPETFLLSEESYKDVDDFQRKLESMGEVTEYFWVDENGEVKTKESPEEWSPGIISTGPINTVNWADLTGITPSLYFGNGRYQATGTVVALKSSTKITATVTAYKYNTSTSRWDYLNSSTQSGTGQVSPSCTGSVSSGLYKAVVSGTCGADSFSVYTERSY